MYSSAMVFLMRITLSYSFGIRPTLSIAAWMASLAEGSVIGKSAIFCKFLNSRFHTGKIKD
jgi:hypothetical protein